MIQKIKSRPVSLCMALLILHIQLVTIFSDAMAGNKSNNISEGNNNSKANIQMNNKSPFIPGDALRIDAFPDTTSVLNKIFAIDGYGRAEFPLIGKTKVTDMSTKELEEYIKQHFKTYLRTPILRITPLIRVSVSGGFNTPGLYYVDQYSTLWDVIRMGGGTTLETGLKEMRWERDHEEQSDDLIPYFERGISLEKMGFKSGDQLWTPAIHETFWDHFRTDIIPLLAFGTTIAFLYMTWRRDMIYIYSR